MVYLHDIFDRGWRTLGNLNKLLKVIATGLVLTQTNVAFAQSDCQWPMAAIMDQQGNGNEYPVTVSLLFEKNGDETISVTEKSLTNLNNLKVKFPVLVQESDGWRGMQSELSCQNRAGEYEFDLIESGGKLQATVGAAVEKFWCASADVPCPTFANPLRFCRKDTNGKVWGARVKTIATIALEISNKKPTAKIVNITSDSQTSNAQNFFRDIMTSPSFALFSITPKTIETQALNAIKKSMETGFRSANFRLPTGDMAPEIPNYEPVLIDSRFVTAADANGTWIKAQTTRKLEKYRESTGCFVAKSLNAIPYRIGATRSGRGVVRGAGDSTYSR